MNPNYKGQRSPPKSVINRKGHVDNISLNFHYKLHQIPKPKYLSSYLAVALAQSIEARW